MEKFSISGIRDLFAADLERFATETSLRLLELLHTTPPPAEALEDATLQAHTLKGLAGTVNAQGLAQWGAHLERLFEVAASFLQADRERANEIFRFVLDHMNHWQTMNQSTVQEDFPQALRCFESLRGELISRWGGYLQEFQSPPPAPQPTAPLEPSSPFAERASRENPAPAATAAPQPSRPGQLPLVPPPLQRKAKPAPPKVSPPVPTSAAPIAPPAPLPLVPPPLRGKPDPAEPAQVPHPPAAELPLPKPLPLVTPVFKTQESGASTFIQRAAESSSAPASTTPVAPPPSGQVPPPAKPGETKPPASTTATGSPAEPGSLQPVPVLPPQLKRRRAKAIQEGNRPPVQPPASTVSTTPAASATSAPAPAAAIPALPVSKAVPPTETPVSTPVPAPAPTTAADADLIEMLRGEVAGYLEELTTTLRELAGHIDQTEAWENARRLFHTIKGTAATFHLSQISAPAKAAEARCIVATEDATARTKETFETCLDRAEAVATTLQLTFDRPDIEARFVDRAQHAQPESTGTALAASTDAPSDPSMVEFLVRDVQDMLGTLEQAILRWERQEDPTQQVEAAQRAFHTIKGAANSIGFKRVGDQVHEAESFLEGVGAGTIKASPGVFAFFLTAVDQLRNYLKRLAANPAAPWQHDWQAALQTLRLEGQPEEAAQAGQRPAMAVSASPRAVVPAESAADDSQTLRIDAGRLHQLMNLIGEMVVDRSRLEKKLDRLVDLQRTLRERNTSLSDSITSFQQQFEFNLMKDRGTGGRSPDRGTDPLPLNPIPGATRSEGEFSEIEFDRYDQFGILARQLIEIAHDIEQLNEEMQSCLESFTLENALFRQSSRVLQEKVVGLSLIPVSTLYPRLERAFRDAVVAEAKEAVLLLEGESTLLDKTVVDRIYAPLLHLLRNSVAHGVEDPAIREKLGKPNKGTVRLRTAQASNQIVITITDDGPGLRVPAIRERAISKGWLAADAPPLSPEQAVQFIFQPAFSTAEKVTSVSGRGIGLDVVRKDIQALNGSVDLKWEEGKGTTWTIQLPLTLSISEAILAESGGQTFAFPLNFLESGVVLEPELLSHSNGRDFYTMGEAKLPFIRLSEVLDLESSTEAHRGLIIAAGDHRTVFAVDRLLSRQEIVVKQLDDQMAQHPLLNGATLDAEGRVVPILNLPVLLKHSELVMARGDSHTTTHSRRGAVSLGNADLNLLKVLIVDDSLSVRKIQERFLQALGADVTTASDGIHALERLREGRFHIVFTDLEMPRLNGYELISEIRSNPAWSALPIVVISSRGADKYITKAMNLGANSFLSKPFTEQQLEQVLKFYAGWDSRTRGRIATAVAA